MLKSATATLSAKLPSPWVNVLASGRAAAIGIRGRQCVIEQDGSQVRVLLGQGEVGLAVTIEVCNRGYRSRFESLAAGLGGLECAIPVAEKNVHFAGGARG